MLYNTVHAASSSRLSYIVPERLVTELINNQLMTNCKSNRISKSYSLRTNKTLQTRETLKPFCIVAVDWHDRTLRTKTYVEQSLEHHARASHETIIIY